jgi:hypothetical protein
LNNQQSSIKFTHEMEVGSITFSDHSAVAHHMYFTDDEEPRRCKHKFEISNLKLIHYHTR